jgi:hypothetical protein
MVGFDSDSVPAGNPSGTGGVSPLNSARSVLSVNAKERALKWKLKDEARRAAQYRLQKECKYTKEKANKIAIEIIKKHDGLWEISPPSTDMLKSLAIDIENGWKVSNSNNRYDNEEKLILHLLICLYFYYLLYLPLLPPFS